MPCRRPDYYDNDKDLKLQLRSEVDKLTKILCSISNADPTDTLTKIIHDNEPFRIILKEHLQVDRDRLYNYYKDKYSVFTRDEIIKMVEQNILPKV